MEFDLKKRHCYWFHEISKIPRGSRNEKAVSDFVVQFAKDHGLQWHQDEVFNVTIDKPASKGYENASVLILQAHMDMVCEKTAGSHHDFLKDPLDLYTDGDLLKAKGTTLGADDGTGVAYMLAILEDETLPHPPLECIFTTMEEIGLLGAEKLKKEDIHGHRLISLDGGGEVVTAASSAGGCDVNLDIDLHMVTNSDPAYVLHVYGLQGGHSGGEIHKERGNANILAVRILEEAESAGIRINLVSLEGGTKDNAITREAEYVFTTAADPSGLLASVKKSAAAIKEELKISDPGFTADCTPVRMPEEHAGDSSSSALLDMIYLMPNGFQHKSLAIEGLTLTSLNLGIVHTEGNHVHMQTLIRSALESGVDNLLGILRKLSSILDISMEVVTRYPGWNYSQVSPMRDKYAKVAEAHGRKLEVSAGHGGLECSIFKGLDPAMDIITFGPVSRYIHTPEEELDLASFDRAYDLLKEIIALCKD
ncbi:MAG: beta-Ala-His dipeptidase [Lactimicrobium sp.]|jgi:dipeptidase D|uniref:beta-Ala-His dipeptidase n=1 Tax=Lactimicrobium sp. TaxID=2563780 RepID=UPI002F357BC8